MGVIEYLQAIRLQGDQAGQFQLDTGRGLPGMAVAEVDVHRAKPEGAGRIHQRFDRRRVLIPRLAQRPSRVASGTPMLASVEALFAQQAHGGPVRVPGVEVDAVVTPVVVKKIEALVQLRHQLLHLGERRCGAAQVKVIDRLAAAELAADQLDFLGEAVQILSANVARRPVQVQCQGPLALAAVAQGAQQVKGADTGMEATGVRFGKPSPTRLDRDESERDEEGYA